MHDSTPEVREMSWPEKATLAMEVCGVCNLRCPMCSYPHLKRKKGMMAWDLFQKIVDDVVTNGHDIGSLHFFGEPLMWPHLVDGVALLSDNGIFPRLSTNGMLLTGDMARRLQDAGLKEVMVTIDTLRPEAYKVIRAGGDFETVRKNIHDAIAAAPKMLIRPQMMPTKHNPGETEDDFYNEFGKHPNIIVQPWFIHRMIEAENLTEDLFHAANEVDKRLCDKPFERVDVLWDGTTVLCCMDAEGTLVTGDLNVNSVAYSWNGPKAVRLRRMILSGEWRKLSACRECMADHVVTDIAPNSWRITNPLQPLPQSRQSQLDIIETLGEYEVTTERWSGQDDIKNGEGDNA
jgi:pyruvate-formate lyase-activating enzyme